MTSRYMTPSLVTETEKAVVQYYELVAIRAGVGYYITNAPWDISYGGYTYISAGALLSIDSVQENIGFEIEKLSITIAGIDPLPGDSDPFIKTILAIDYVDKPVIIHRAYYNHDVYVNSVEVYNGYINKAGVTNGLGESGAAVRIETSNNWTDFSKISARYTNDTSQQNLFLDDLGFEYAVEVQKSVEWKEPE